MPGYFKDFCNTGNTCTLPLFACWPQKGLQTATTTQVLPARCTDAHGMRGEEEDQGVQVLKQPLTPSARREKTWRRIRSGKGLKSQANIPRRQSGGEWEEKRGGEMWWDCRLPVHAGILAHFLLSLSQLLSVHRAVWPRTLLGCRQPLAPPPPHWQLDDDWVKEPSTALQVRCDSNAPPNLNNFHSPLPPPDSPSSYSPPTWINGLYYQNEREIYRFSSIRIQSTLLKLWRPT